MEYQERFYRRQYRHDDLTYFQVTVKETDLFIGVRRERFDPAWADWVEEMVRRQRIQLEEYIQRDPTFLRTLTPHTLLPDAPRLAVNMAEATALVGVGPMASVAGAIADQIGSELVKRSKDVIIENGGDIYLRSTRQRRIGIFAGDSPLSGRVGLLIKPEDTPVGICTSSGSVGHSLSLGQADATVILAPSATLADAVATAAANIIQGKEDLQRAVEYAMSIPGVTGALAIKEDQLAACGRLKLVPIEM